MKMLSRKNSGIVLPDDVVHEMFMKYCDHDTLCSTRELQSPRVRRCTQFGQMSLAIQAGNVENIKWIDRQNDERKNKDNVYLGRASESGHLDCFK